MKNLVKRLKVYRQALVDLGVQGTVSFRGEQSHFVRCGCNRISLSTSEELDRIFIDLQKDGRAISGSISLGVDGDQGVLDLIENLNSKLPYMHESSDLADVDAFEEEFQCFEQREEVNFDTNIAVNLFKKAIDRFADLGDISGAFTGSVSTYATVNSASALVNGTVVEDCNAELVLFTKEGKELRSAGCGNSIGEINHTALIDEIARNLALKESTPLEDLDPGKYDIVFHADAIRSMIGFMGWVMFSGENYDQGSSMVGEAGIGGKELGDNITFSDNPNDAETLYRRGVGMNGVVRNPMTLVKNGVVENFFYSDRKLAKRFGKTVNNDQSCSSIKLAGGTGVNTFDELVKQSTKPILYIPFIHYMNLTNVSKGEFTGASRFGTFLIENGKVRAHLHNLRINDSLKRIFNNVEWLSEETQRVDNTTTYFMRNPEGATCPRMMLVKDVNITGSSSTGE